MNPPFAKGGIVKLSLQGSDGVFRPIGADSPEMFMPSPGTKRPEVITMTGTGKANPDVVAIIAEIARDVTRKMIVQIIARYLILNMVRMRAGLPILPIERFGPGK